MSTLSKLNSLLAHDRAMRKRLHERIIADGLRPPTQLIGLDEVGRGSLIIGVVAAAVCLPEKLGKAEKNLLAKLNDSKKLNHAIRADIVAALNTFAQIAIGKTTREEVDRLNVYHASYVAMRRALDTLMGCQPAPETAFLLIDGRTALPGYALHHQCPIVKGDGLSAAIAAASIIAKEYRDACIRQLHDEYPHYGWDTNMGYATPAHCEAIQQWGLTQHHRRSFRLKAFQTEEKTIITDDEDEIVPLSLPLFTG